MGITGQFWAALAGAGTGALAGVLIRVVLARLRRGVDIRPGPVEAAAAVVTAAAAAVGWGGPLLALLVWTGWVGVALGAVDLLRHRLPDALTVVALAGSVALVLATELFRPGAGSLLRAGLAGVALTVVFGLLRLATRGGLGLGDVKFAPTVGVLSGYASAAGPIVALLGTFVLGSVVALVGLALRRMRLSSSLPLGPYMAFGCFAAVALSAAGG